jgi:nitrogen-specific signal transduction histidine kinase
VSKVILSHNGLIKCSRIKDLTIFKISLPII